VGVPWGEVAGWTGTLLGCAAGLRLAQLDVRDSRVWEGAVWAIERRIRRQIATSAGQSPAPPRVVFAGSSSIRRWRTLAADLAPLQTLNVGFGGALLPQVAHYAGRLILPWQPAGVVLYAGENDLAPVLFRRPDPAEGVVCGLRELICGLLRELPGVSIWCLALKRSHSRPASWPAVDQVNTQLEEWCATQAGVEFIDTCHPLLDESGRPRRELFCLDGIHLNPAGYAAWTSAVRPRLAERFGCLATADRAPAQSAARGVASASPLAPARRPPG